MLGVQPGGGAAAGEITVCEMSPEKTAARKQALEKAALCKKLLGESASPKLALENDRATVDAAGWTTIRAKKHKPQPLAPRPSWKPSPLSRGFEILGMAKRVLEQRQQGLGGQGVRREQATQ